MPRHGPGDASASASVPASAAAPGGASSSESLPLDGDEASRTPQPDTASGTAPAGDPGVSAATGPGADPAIAGSAADPRTGHQQTRHRQAGHQQTGHQQAEHRQVAHQQVGHRHSGHHHGIGAATARDTSGRPVPASRRFRGRLTAAFSLTASLFVAELVVGLLAGSLAVVADSGHLATDVVTLGAALVATRIATRPDHTGRRTYGRYRAEVFAAGMAVLLMVAVGAFVVAGAITRIGGEPHVATGPMAIVGAVGLLVNLACLLLLHAGAGESLNVRGAYLEVLGDAAGSVGVLVASGLIAWTGSPVWDVVVAIGIGVFVVVRAVGLGRSVLRVLGQQAPRGMDPQQVAEDLAAIGGVADVHDLHLWELTSGMTVATAHLVSTDGADHHAVLDRARDVLFSHYRIEHATLQIEPADHTSCGNIDW